MSDINPKFIDYVHQLNINPKVNYSDIHERIMMIANESLMVPAHLMKTQTDFEREYLCMPIPFIQPMDKPVGFTYRRHIPIAITDDGRLITFSDLNLETFAKMI